MVTLHRFAMGLASALAVCGMTALALAHDSDENEAAEHSGSHAESHDESSEHGGSHNENAEHGGSSSGSSESDRDNRNGRESSRDDSRRGVSSRSGPARTATTARGNSSRNSVASRSTRSRDGGTERKASLRTLVGGRGSAEYKVSGSRRSFEVELENTTLSPGSTLSVCVNDISVGQMTVGRYGRRTRAQLKLDTRIGQSVPTITTGSVITVKYSTATVASGTF